MNLSQFTLDAVPANAKLYVYLTGTTTAATYYTDAAGTTAGSNPQSAGVAGMFAPIYLDPSITYRIKVTDSAGTTTLYDIDPVRVYDEGTADGVLVIRSRDAAKKRTAPETVTAIYTTGYAATGDRGQALYKRVASVPSHNGWLRTAEGTYWELSENILNPFMFGAKGDNSTNDSAAIQAMFDFVTAKGTPYPVNFMGAKYYVHDPLLLPKVSVFTQMDIDGAGATLRTDQAITILGCPPLATQSAADVAIGQNAFDIHNINFEGNQTTGQVGLHLMATYTSVVRSCYFANLDYGSIGTFCIASAWRDNRYFYCVKRAAVIQAADSFLTGSLLWTSATVSGSGCNVSVFDNCRVFGHPSQDSAFGIFGSDAVRMSGCISEGAGAKYDLHFDYQGATTIKQFHVHMFHAEAPSSKLNFKIRATGQVVIDTLWTQYPAAIYDAKDSVNCDILIKGINYLGNPPVPGGTYNAVTNPNPYGRWFYHAGGNGYGAATEGSGSSGITWRFEDCYGSAYVQFSDPAKWEGGVLPVVLNVRGALASNGGVGEYSNAPIKVNGELYLKDGTKILGLQQGIVSSTTTSIAANSSVTEVFAVTGIKWNKQSVIVHPYNSAVPPAGIVWQAWIEGDDEFRMRFTNVTGSTLSLTSGANWRYCAPRYA
ncbi:glycoside hydrolase family 55 protein [Sphingomonas sp. LB-2]|uniref:glycoside hydrolase family 55 protein n=1 Tax=Sphingomonas caeni TaxID=2984949 RepID=UPI0022326BEC|nr:glycoside hydrolase family 55 protein [Sphingomonas caeni]MCW3847587.1 glycoside hydrolase family 55 protein [Sphingomonas caeni]